MFTVVLPVESRLPPAPCPVTFPSSNNQSICTLDGGALLVLLYWIDCKTSFTCAPVTPASKVIASSPLRLVYVPISDIESSSVPEFRTRLPVVLNTSSELAPPDRLSVTVAPPKSSASDSSASATSSPPFNVTGLPASVKPTVFRSPLIWRTEMLSRRPSILAVPFDIESTLSDVSVKVIVAELESAVKV